MIAVKKIYFKSIEICCDNSMKREVILAWDIREVFLEEMVTEGDLEGDRK